MNGKNNMHNFIREKTQPAIIIAAAIIFALVVRPAFAATGSLALRSNASVVSVGDQFTVSVIASSDANVNTIGMDLNYPSDLLEVKNVAGPSVITLFITKGVVSAGTAAIEGGVLPTKTLKNDKVGMITFLAKKSGNAVLKISNASGLYANDGLGTNILSSYGSLTLKIGKAPVVQNSNVSVPAVGLVRISSSSNPDQNIFYNQRTVMASWNADNADGYAFVFDQVRGTVPNLADLSPKTAGEFTAASDGVWYLHVIAARNGVGGQVAEYVFNIDETPPRLDLSLSNNVIRSDGSSEVIFSASDDLSGVAGYEIGIAKDGETPVYEAATSPWVLKDLASGQYQVIVRATDGAGNAATAENALSVTSTPTAPWWVSLWTVAAAGGFSALIIIFYARIFGRGKKKNA
jgi:hypothetical protein